MRLCERWIERERALGGNARERERLGRRHRAEDPCEDEDVSDAGMREREVRVQRQRPLEQLEGSLDARPDLIPGVTTAQIEFVRLEIRGPAWRDRGTGRVQERDLERVDDRRRDLILDVEDVGVLTIVPLGPELESARDIRELHGHAQPVARAANAALEHGANAQLLAHHLEIDAGSAKRER
jgi:hypothetical protein